MSKRLGMIDAVRAELWCLARAAGLLMYSVSSASEKRGRREVREERRVLESGTEYELYEPDRPAMKTCILIHGLTMRGPSDLRLVNFARAMASSGLRVAVPSLEGLRSFRFDRSDPETVKELVLAVRREHGGKIGVIGFSVGGGYALIAASDKEIARHIDPLILFGAHHSLAGVWQDLLVNYQTEPAPEDSEAWEKYLWLRLVLASRERVSSRLTAEENAELTELLHTYCDDPSIECKRDFYDRCLKGRFSVLHQNRTEAAKVLEALSPSGKLGHVEARVYLLHDPHDGLVPARESVRICDELSRRDGERVQELLITPLIAHVKARFTWNLWHIWRLLRFFGEVFRKS